MNKEIEKIKESINKCLALSKDLGLDLSKQIEDLQDILFELERGI